MRWLRALLLAGICGPIAATASPSSSASPPSLSPSPKLVVFVVIDQARGDYFERFRPVLVGGIRTLLERGVVFDEAHHRHATTVTAAGHASLATGLYPAHSGMVGNDWFDRSEGRGVYSVEDRDPGSAILPPAGARPGSWSSAGRSPKRLRGTALGDWMRAKWPDARVFSIGGKDRSAILMAGKRPSAAYWYDQRSGQWITSRYYLPAYPGWVREIQERRPADRYFQTTWEALPVEPSLLSAMEIAASSPAAGADGPGVPIALGGGGVFPDRNYYARLFGSPFLETELVDFAEALVENEGLGRDDSPDLLTLELASVDAVGHAYGPDSRELLDAVMHADRELGRFFDFLDGRIGLANVAIALSSDHGVAPLPEVRRARDLPGSRPTASESECFARAGAAFETRFGKADWFLAPFYFDHEVLAAHGVELDTAAAFLARELSRCPGVVHVWTMAEMQGTAGPGETSGWEAPLAALYRNGFDPERSPDLVPQFEEYRVERVRGTTHGSPYAYDTRVPFIVLWPGAPPRRIEVPVATVDLPVTLATLLGVETPSSLDGVDRSALVR